MTKTERKIYSKEDIKRATAVDMVSFVQSHGKGELSGGGRYPKYLINGHDSIVIDRRMNRYFHNGQGTGDNIIGLLTKYEGYGFQQAVALLLGDDFEPYKSVSEEELTEEYQYQYELDHEVTVAKDYLIKQRGIDKDIVDYLVEQKFLVQDKRYKSAVLNWKPLGLGSKEPIGATSILTGHVSEGSPKKYIMKTSEKNYGFNITLGEPRKYYFFEASIDLLSYWSLNKDLTDARLICLEGLKPETVLKFVEEGMKEFETLPTEGIYYGVDNDVAGQRFFDKIDRQFNFRNTQTNQLITNHALIVDDYVIPTNFMNQLTSIAEEKEIDWRLLATVAKVENNFSTQNRMANALNLYGYFAENDREPKKVVDVTNSLEKLASVIQENNLTIDTLVSIYQDREQPLSESERLWATDKFKEVYEVFSSEQFRVKDNVAKDWNNQLLVERAGGLKTELETLYGINEAIDSISRETKGRFTYYLQDAADWENVKNRLTNVYQVDEHLVNALMSKRLIRQDENQRIVYLWAKDGEVRGGQYTGTIEDKSFGRQKIEKGIMDLSQEGYGFNFTIGQPNTIYFFQSPEDLLAYWSLKKGELKNATLFSLSDDSPQSMIDIINERLQEGAAFKTIHVTINHTKSGAELLDGISQLEAFNRQDRTLRTHNGDVLPIQSERPIFGKTWSEENVAKKQRMARLNEYYRFQKGNQQKQSFGMTTQEKTPSR
ncbi:toprim domain-containing protein [Vagococcus xieshaowenii]|uniref:DUF3991 domain-containing protein n=1 Tax=Vagococcus xieshaowenii TaxID=2562451 RepID=A0AAJ5EGT8_9ENTE|nr:toprim domain-containing protein [Vagococcus xieshaowenii]QCA29691.1 DUF3991 domain-containing protein [Vagococcus xieshaowenii]TFZ42966.1 DUF3991 domain-containing protein [Vagococcus xieshaowenii]